MEKIKVLFVCLGNICRSPMAEGIFLHLVEEAGLQDRFHVDSAGTSGYHAGERADRRMRETAKDHGVHLPSRSRMFLEEDLREFHYVIAMDTSNRTNMLALKRSGIEYGAEVLMMRKFDEKADSIDVPDPYYGGQRGFEDVYEMLDRANASLLAHIRKKHDF